MYIEKLVKDSTIVYSPEYQTFINLRDVLYMEGGANLHGLEKELPLRLYLKSSPIPYSITRDSSLHKLLLDSKTLYSPFLIHKTSKAMINVQELSIMARFIDDGRYCYKLHFTNGLIVEIPTDLFFVLSEFFKYTAKEEMKGQTDV